MEGRVERMLLARKIVLCNKSDVQPCPLPEIAALEPGTIFLAGSATRGTNMKVPLVPFPDVPPCTAGPTCHWTDLPLDLLATDLVSYAACFL